MGFNIAYMAGHFTVLEFVQAVLVQGVDKDVVIRGEIDRGGVIAAIAGTQQVIDSNDAQLITSFIIN